MKKIKHIILMNMNISKLLLSAAFVMCCTNAWALYGTRGGTYFGQVTVNGGIYELYQDYSYSYESTTRSVSGNCAVLVDFTSAAAPINRVESTVTYNGNVYTVVAIGEQVFKSHDEMILEFTIPNTVRVLETFALEDNTRVLRRVVLEDGNEDLFCYRTTDGYGAFSWNKALKDVYIGRNLKYQKQDEDKIDYAPFYKGDFRWLTVEFGPTVTEIPQYCFYSSDFRYLDFSRATSLRTIGKKAFYWNNSCEEIDLRNCAPDLAIGESCFQDCDALRQVTIGGSATQIGHYAFYDCNVLVRVAIIGDVSAVGNTAFLRLQHLELILDEMYVYFLSSRSPQFGEGCFDIFTAVYVRDASRLNDFRNHYNFGDAIHAIPETQKLKYTTTDGRVSGTRDCILNVYENGMGTMYFEHELAEIVESTFSGCQSLLSVTIPSSLRKIGKNAFYQCVNLRSVLILGTINGIHDYAFSGCVELHELFYLGDNRPLMGENPFFYCPVTIYVKDATGQTWDGRPVRSWRSGKGDGSQGNPLEIENYVNLYGFAIEVSIMGSENLYGKLTADIVGNSNVLDANGNPNPGTYKEWLPIGSSDKAFCGEFNGNGHTISGLYHNHSDSSVGLFGKTGEGAYIHDLGLVDSYMSGGGLNGGICGDMAYGHIDNCYNAATAAWGGGVAGWCREHARISNCHNVGHIFTNGSGITDLLAENGIVENCYALEGVSRSAINNIQGTINKVEVKNAAAFASGEVCWILNGNKYGGRWRQQLGTDAYPTTSGTYFVNYTDERQYYNNEPSQEIRYTSTDDKIVTPNNPDSFGASINYNTYEGGQGVITFDRAVTSIGNDAFHNCSSLLSATIPNRVTSIGQHAFSDCNSLATVTFNSLPVLGTEAFYPCANLNSRILDLTDSDKPYIGASTENYPGFTEARYHGMLEPNQWGTIILPFVPSSHSGIVFFSIDNVDAANGILTLSVAENIVAGKPYLFRNQTGDAGFTLSATPAAPATEVPVNVTTSEQTVGDFALKGNYSNNNVLTEDGLYQLDGGEFVKVGSLNIDPFRAYLKDNGGSALTRIVIDGGTSVKITMQDDSVVALYGLKE
ncbi:MAG: leucine-rich repeat protein, partial [Bacteroidia bacterium]|nr:leucine-rich repeat protein [Bacteroidia bacterium]